MGMAIVNFKMVTSNMAFGGKNLISRGILLHKLGFLKKKLFICKKIQVSIYYNLHNHANCFNWCSELTHYPADMFYYTSFISPHAILAPALPVILLTKPSCGGPGKWALELSPKPRSSSLAWIIMERPTTEPNFS